MECLKHSWWNVWNFQKLRYHFEWQSWYAFLLAVGRKFSLHKKFRRRHLKGVIIKLEKRLKLSFVWRKIFLSYLDYFLKLLRMPFNLLTTNVPHHIETSQLICSTNQLEKRAQSPHIFFGLLQFAGFHESFFQISFSFILFINLLKLHKY